MSPEHPQCLQGLAVGDSRARGSRVSHREYIFYTSCIFDRMDLCLCRGVSIKAPEAFVCYSTTKAAFQTSRRSKNEVNAQNACTRTSLRTRKAGSTQANSKLCRQYATLSSPRHLDTNLLA